MKLIVGLGNVGIKYQNTRHNIGFRLLDQLKLTFGQAAGYTVDDFKKELKFKAAIAHVRGNQGQIKYLLVKPSSMMNLSGLSVALLLKFYKLNPEQDLVVIFDDLDIKLGSYKIDRKKSPKTHKGVSSVVTHIYTNNFVKVRIGIDNRLSQSRVPGDVYVLDDFTREEENLIEKEVFPRLLKDLQLYL